MRVSIPHKLKLGFATMQWNALFWPFLGWEQQGMRHQGFDHTDDLRHWWDDWAVQVQSFDRDLGDFQVNRDGSDLVVTCFDFILVWLEWVIMNMYEHFIHFWTFMNIYEHVFKIIPPDLGMKEEIHPTREPFVCPGYAEDICSYFPCCLAVKTHSLDWIYIYIYVCFVLFCWLSKSK